MSSRKLKISLVRSRIGLLPGHVRTLEALGLRRIRASVVHDDTAVIRGMIARVSYAIEVTLPRASIASLPCRKKRSPFPSSES